MLIAASLVVFLLAALHSGLGEWFIFRHIQGVSGFRSLGFPPILGSPAPPQASLRSTWHNLTILGLAVAVILGRLALLPTLTESEQFLARVISFSLLASSVLWFAATRGKHVGWLGFLLAAGLAWFGAR
jgi:hypothetical protein